MLPSQVSLVERLQGITEAEKSSYTKFEMAQANAFVEELITLPMNLKKLRQKTFNGCPDTLPDFRPTIWKIFLNYLVEF